MFLKITQKLQGKISVPENILGKDFDFREKYLPLQLDYDKSFIENLVVTLRSDLTVLFQLWDRPKLPSRMIRKGLFKR